MFLVLILTQNSTTNSKTALKLLMDLLSGVHTFFKHAPLPRIRLGFG